MPFGQWDLRAQWPLPHNPRLPGPTDLAGADPSLAGVGMAPPQRSWGGAMAEGTWMLLRLGLDEIIRNFTERR